MKDILIVKPKALIKRNVLDDLYNTILAQKEKGVIILPMWCDYELVNVEDGFEAMIVGIEKGEEK